MTAAETGTPMAVTPVATAVTASQLIELPATSAIVDRIPDHGPASLTPMTRTLRLAIEDFDSRPAAMSPPVLRTSGCLEFDNQVGRNAAPVTDLDALTLSPLANL